LQESDLDLLLDAAREAGTIALGHWRKDPKVWEKGVDGPVSEADFAVDAFLRDLLGAARPDYGWLSEETPDDPAARAASRIFVVDPIDGTRAYVAGEATWAHSLAVVEDGRPVAAVVHLPVRGKTYAAALGHGATLNGVPLEASDRSEVAGATFLAARVSFEAQHWKGPVPHVDRAFRPSLAYRLALVGEGRFDGMLTLRPTWEWDVAAGALVATEAGATVTDRRGRPLRFNNPDPRLDGVLAAGPLLHAAVHRRLS
jgi:myo-inositol-1(or 4)-monophosphatase